MSKGVRLGLQAVLAVVIVVLAYWLYVSLTAPYELIERERLMTEATRQRMDHVRTALIRYERQNERFPSTLDSLELFVERDSLLSLRADSIFGEGWAGADSLIYSPRTGKPFEYAVNDTGRVVIYLLQDPDSNDRIGSERPDVTQLNAASWE